MYVTGFDLVFIMLNNPSPSAALKLEILLNHGVAISVIKTFVNFLLNVSRMQFS